MKRMIGISRKNQDEIKKFFTSLHESDTNRKYIKTWRDPIVRPRKTGPYPNWVNTYKILPDPYDGLTLPILRNFYPKLIAKELVNVVPINNPDIIKAFMRPKFARPRRKLHKRHVGPYNYIKHMLIETKNEIMGKN